MATEKWKVCALDIWGNANDGYYVNDVFVSSYIYIDSEGAEAAVLKALTEDGYAGMSRCKISDFEPDYITVDRKSDGKPTLTLLRVEGT